MTWTNEDLARMMRDNPELGIDHAVTVPTAEPVNDKGGAGNPLEYDMQKELFDTLPVHLHPDLALLFAIPNHWRRGERPPAGQKAGVPDMLLPVARGGYHGLFVELKRWKEKPRSNQLEWHERLRGEGYRVEVCDTVSGAMAAVVGYVASTPSPV